MKEHFFTGKEITEYEHFLKREEREEATIDKYLHELEFFFRWLEGKAVTKEAVIKWKEHLQENNYAPATVNVKISALNGFFKFLGWEECKVKFLKIQRQIFRKQSRELTKEEYDGLVATARREGKDRLALVMETICAAGIRVSELPYITVEAAKEGRAKVVLKGKIRIILLPGKLCRKLLKYAKEQKITSGEIFLTKSGNSLSRRQVWREMKGLCKRAHVESSKVFPHNLRHLFAVSFYKVCKDIAKLADVLGHSTIETTRIYLVTAGEEHSRQLERMGLVT